MVIAAMEMAIIPGKNGFGFLSYFDVSDGFGGPLWVKKLPRYHIFYHATAQVMGRNVDRLRERLVFGDVYHIPP